MKGFAPLAIIFHGDSGIVGLPSAQVLFDLLFGTSGVLTVGIAAVAVYVAYRWGKSERPPGPPAPGRNEYLWEIAGGDPVPEREWSSEKLRQTLHHVLSDFEDTTAILNLTRKRSLINRFFMLFIGLELGLDVLSFAPSKQPVAYSFRIGVAASVIGGFVGMVVALYKDRGLERRIGEIMVRFRERHPDLKSAGETHGRVKIIP